MANSNWKNFERKVAKDVGGERVLMKGTSAPDVEVIIDDNCLLMIECKLQKMSSFKEWWVKLQKREDDRRKNIIKVLCWRQPGKKKTRVFITFEDLMSLVCEAGWLVKSEMKDPVQISYDDFIYYVDRAKRLGI